MVGPIREEFEGVDLGDHRLNMRVLRSVETMAVRSDAPFPELFSHAELQGIYRLLGHDEVSPEQLLQPHYGMTAQRAAGRDLVLVLHDSSNITHGNGSQGRDFYELGSQLYGYVSHVSLLATPERLPLGIGNLQFVERGTDEPESARWEQGVVQTAERFAGCTLLHVMDSEADSYELYARLLQQGHRFVIRSEPRNVAVHSGRRWETRPLVALLQEQPVQLVREVELSKRTASDPKSKRNPSRAARTATLSIRATRVYLPRSSKLRGTGPRGLPVRIELNVVLVSEDDPPAGEPAVQWVLLTSEPIDTLAQVEAVVDAYRARWLIEELFKALKTGCAFERRQFEYQHTSQNALALTLPVAWQLLLLRHVERQHSSASAQDLLGEALPVLRAIAKSRLPPRLTIERAVQAIAELGGHKKSNGPVGWLVLARGFQRLRDAVVLAHQLRRSAALHAEEREM